MPSCKLLLPSRLLPPKSEASRPPLPSDRAESARATRPPRPPPVSWRPQRWTTCSEAARSALRAAVTSIRSRGQSVAALLVLHLVACKQNRSLTLRLARTCTAEADGAVHASLFVGEVAPRQLLPHGHLSLRSQQRHRHFPALARRARLADEQLEVVGDRVDRQNALAVRLA